MKFHYRPCETPKRGSCGKLEYIFSMASEMKAMLLAAGEGQRLRPLTDGCPKPMLKIGAAPILEHNVKLLRKHGIVDIAINLHHRPDAITDYFADGQAFGVNIRYSYEPELLGTAGAVARLRDFFDRRFFVIYGDNLTDCRLDKMLARHLETESLCTLALFHREDVQASGVASLGRDGRIETFVEKPAPGMEVSHWVNAGILCCEPAILDFIPPAGPSDFGRDVLPQISGPTGRVFAYLMSETLLWIDSPADHLRTQQMVLDERPETDFLRL